MNKELITLKNIGFLLLGISALTMVILSITGHAITIESVVSSCTETTNKVLDNCGAEIHHKKLSGLFITSIIIGVAGVISLVLDMLTTRSQGKG